MMLFHRFLWIAVMIAIVGAPVAADRIGTKFKAPYGFSCRVNLTQERAEFIVPNKAKPASLTTFRKVYQIVAARMKDRKSLRAFLKSKNLALDNVIRSCQAKAKALFETPTPAPTSPIIAPTAPIATASPTSTRLPPPTVQPPTSTPLPTLCKDYSIYWNVSIPNDSIAGAEFSTTISPNIKRNQVFLIHGFWHAAFPFLTQSSDMVATARQVGRSVEQVGDTYYIHGGIPQRADYATHYAILDGALAGNTSADFSRLIVIDFEDWFPTWDTLWESQPNTNPYKIASIAYAHTTNPQLKGTALIEKAKSQFETAGLNLYLQTVLHIKSIRPHAKVGVYDLLNRIYWNGYSSESGDFWRSMNEKSLAVHKAADVIIADIYQFYPSYNNGLPATFQGTTWYAPPDSTKTWYNANELYVRDNVLEAKRVAALAGGKPVIVYAWPRYHEGGGLRFLTSWYPPQIFSCSYYTLMISALTEP